MKKQKTPLSISKSLPSQIESGKWRLFHKFAVGAIVILFFINQALTMSIGQKLIGAQPGEVLELSGNFSQDISLLVTPQTLPFYGPELGLDFSSISAINSSIKKMSVMAPKQGSNPIELTEAEMKRYVAIGTEPTITCEFCCSVKILVREDGTPSCGCAHSIAMRGMVAYLLQNYPEMTNAEISYEVVRQKGLYFPKQLQKRMASSLAGKKEDFTPDIRYLTQDLTPEELNTLQEQSKESGFEPEINAPGMVGGC